MNIYSRIKTLLLEVSGRNDPALLGSISRKHARKTMASGNYKGADHRLAKKYNAKQGKLIDLAPSNKPSRFPGHGGTFKAKL